MPSVKDATAKPPQDLPAAAVEKRCRILVVDDVRASARAAQVLLSRMGHDVDVATNGEDALDAAVKFRPDVIFLDISLPDFDGYEVARRLRKKSGLKHVTLAALTGHSPADVNESDRARFDHFLVKPIDIKALKAVLVSVAKSQDPIDSDSAEDNQ